MSVSTLLTTVGWPNSRGSPGTAACCVARHACPRSTRRGRSPRRRCTPPRRAGSRHRTQARPEEVAPSRPASRAASIALASAPPHRVLAANVEIAATRAGRERGDRHGLQDRERVAFHEDPVLERPGLGLVGVAHEEVVGRLRRDGVPLAPGRECRSAAADEARGVDFSDLSSGPSSMARMRASVAAAGAVGAEAPRVDVPTRPRRRSPASTRLGRRGQRRRGGSRESPRVRVRGPEVARVAQDRPRRPVRRRWSAAPRRRS